MPDSTRRYQFLDPARGIVPVIVLMGILGAGFFLSVDDFPKQTLCIFKRLFLFDCPGCGLTRAFLLIPQGHWHEAFALNGASVLLYFVFLFWLIRTLLLKFNIKHEALKSLRVNTILAMLVVVSVTVQWVFKLFEFFSHADLLAYADHLMKQPLLFLF